MGRVETIREVRLPAGRLRRTRELRPHAAEALTGPNQLNHCAIINQNKL